MRAMLVLLALAAGAAAFYLAGDRGVTDPAVIAVAATAVFALAMFRMTPSSARPKPRGATAQLTRSGAIRGEASELAGTLDALADARAARNEEALDSRNAVAVYLSRVGENQIAVIKVLRAHFNLDLKDAKDLTDSAKHGQKPSLGQTVPVSAARALQKDIEKAGGELEIR